MNVDKSILDFCEVAVLNVNDLYKTFRYKYFEGYLVLLVHADIYLVDIAIANPVIMSQRKRFANGLGKGKNTYIRLSTMYLCASPNCVEFLLYHEIGHIRNKDMQITEYREKRKEAILTGVIMMPERLADMYAAKKVGKSNAIKALEEMIKRTTRTLAHITKFSLVYKDKIKEIPNLYDQTEEKKSSLVLSIRELEFRLEALKGLNVK